MDPLTQGLLGAAAAQAVFSRQLGRYAWVIGMASGMAADLDVVIESSTDPLLGMMVHRGFTHAMAFVPIGAAIAALPFLWIKSLRYRRRAILGASLLAYATHAPLDALTSYGTLLFWPFSDYRVALDWMPIIEPVFTLMLLIGVIVAAWKRSVKPARVALLAGALYVSLGAIQHQRALTVQLDLADSRIHTIERRRVMPTLGNLVVWRSVYQAKGLLQADMIRLPAQGVATYRPGERLMLRVSKDRPQPPADSVLARDIARFTWFSDGFIAPVGGDLNLLGDMRYSLESHRFRPLWAIRIDPARPDQHVTIEYLRRSDARDSIDQLLRDIWYQNPDDPLVDDIGVVETPRRRP